MVDRIQHAGCYVGLGRYVCGGDRGGADCRLFRSKNRARADHRGGCAQFGAGGAHLKKFRRLSRLGRYAEAKAFGEAQGIDADKAQSISYLQLFLSDERRHTIWLGLSFLLNWVAIEVFVVLA
jgi:hypothetical protein